jgi:hypothetical protein
VPGQLAEKGLNLTDSEAGAPQEHTMDSDKNKRQNINAGKQNQLKSDIAALTTWLIPFSVYFKLL